jgi:hypothetical protein
MATNERVLDKQRLRQEARLPQGRTLTAPECPQKSMGAASF